MYDIAFNQYLYHCQSFDAKLAYISRKIMFSPVMKVHNHRLHGINAQERLQLVDQQRHHHHALLLRQGTVQFGRRQRHLAAASRRRRAAGASLQLLHSLVSSTKLTINQPSALNLY